MLKLYSLYTICHNFVHTICHNKLCVQNVILTLVNLLVLLYELFVNTEHE